MKNEDSPPATQAVRGSVLGWFTLSGIILAVILIPFLLFGEAVESWSAGLLEGRGSRERWLIAASAVVLLASDVLLPIPSSLVSTGCGMALGFPVGAGVSLIGMTAGCWVGYLFGATAGRGAARRLIGGVEIHRLESAWGRYGDWVLVLFRPVPVLAEASVMFAGLGGMRGGRFTLLTLLSNMGVSVVYAAVGAFAAEVNSFLLAFAGSILLPGAAMLALRMTRRRG